MENKSLQVNNFTARRSFLALIHPPVVGNTSKVFAEHPPVDTMGVGVKMIPYKSPRLNVPSSVSIPSKCQREETVGKALFHICEHTSTAAVNDFPNQLKFLRHPSTFLCNKEWGGAQKSLLHPFQLIPILNVYQFLLPTSLSEWQKNFKRCRLREITEIYEIFQYND